jgi:hypothetical protein
MQPFDQPEEAVTPLRNLKILMFAMWLANGVLIYMHGPSKNGDFWRFGVMK